MTKWMGPLIGALGGAAIAVAVVYGLTLAGLMPEQRVGETQIHDYLLAHPDILVAMSDKLQMQQAQSDDEARQAAVTKLGPHAFFDSKVAFVTGPADAKTTFVEFFDYECPFCRASHPAIESFYNSHKEQVRFAFIELPLPSLHGPSAVLAARASLAAQRQPGKFVAFHFALMGEDGTISQDVIDADARKVGLDVAKLNKDMADPAIDAAMARARALADAAGIDGTPAFVINGKAHEGALKPATLNALLKG